MHIVRSKEGRFIRAFDEHGARNKNFARLCVFDKMRKFVFSSLVHHRHVVVRTCAQLKRRTYYAVIIISRPRKRTQQHQNTLHIYQYLIIMYASRTHTNARVSDTFPLFYCHRRRRRHIHVRLRQRVARQCA